MTLSVLTIVLACASLVVSPLARSVLSLSLPPAGVAWNAEAGDVDYFSGEVSEVSSSSIEVVRSSLGRNDQRRFSLTEDTRIEGTARRGSRVTVGYNSSTPSVAVRVIVRED